MELEKVLGFILEDERAKREFERLPYRAPDWARFIIERHLFEDNRFFEVLFQELLNFMNDKPNLRANFDIFKEFKREILIALVRDYLSRAIEDYQNLPDEVKKIINHKDYVLVEEAIKYIDGILADQLGHNDATF